MKQGDILYVKTTNECVYVMSVNDGEGTAVVRRPAGTREHGIVHNINTFNQDELMTREESNEIQIQEQLTEYKRMMKLQELTRPEPAVAAKIAVVN